MITAGFIGGLAMFFIGIAILALISSVIRILGPILIVVGIYYVIKTLMERSRQGSERPPQAPVQEEPVEFKDEAEILAEKYERTKY